MLFTSSKKKIQIEVQWSLLFTFFQVFFLVTWKTTLFLIHIS